MKNTFILICIAVFAVPLSSIIPIRGADVWYSQYLGLLTVLLLGLSLDLWKFNKWISLFSVCCLYSALFVAHQNPRTMMCLFQLYLSFFTIKKISEFHVKQRKILLWVIFGFTILQGLYVVVQYLNMDPIFSLATDPTKDDTVGFVGSHNQLGLFASVTAPVVWYIFPGAIPLSIFCIVMSKTSTSWVAFVLGSIAYSFFGCRKKIWISITVALLLISSLFFLKVDKFSTGEARNRFNLYKHTINASIDGKIVMDNAKGKTLMVETKPLVGFGLSNFMVISPHTQSGYIKDRHRYSHAHNDYVELFFELGWGGLILLCLIMFDFFKKFIQAERTKILVISFSAVLIHMINALGIFTVHTAASGFLLILFLGIFYGEVRDGKRKQSGPSGLVQRA